MNIKTLREILQWSVNFHMQLKYCMEDCAEKSLSDQEEMLLLYLAEQEGALAKVLANFDNAHHSRTLDIRCYNYLARGSMIRQNCCSDLFIDLKGEEIIIEIDCLHDQVIELHKYLLSQTSTGTVRDLLQNLIQLETNESMNIVKSSYQLVDI